MKKILFILLIFFSGFCFSQELDASVSVNSDNLPINNRELLANFAPMIENYLNKTKFTGKNWEYTKIKCSFSIFMLSAPDEINYTAQIVVRSLRKIDNTQKYSPLILVNDNNWQFVYDKNMQLMFDPNQFVGLTSLLDFYAFMIIGYELDSWDKLSGQFAFESAFNLSTLAAGNSTAKGWETSSGSYSRKDLVQNILSEKYRPIREAASDYQTGVDQYHQPNRHEGQNNKASGQKKMVKLIAVFETLKSKIDIRSVYVKAFFEAKSGEIIDYLKDYADKSIFKTLKSVDPPRYAKYDEAMK